jgi:hypothetical protein
MVDVRTKSDEQFSLFGKRGTVLRNAASAPPAWPLGRWLVMQAYNTSILS